MSNEEKKAFNLALTKAAKIVFSYDGAIPNEFDRTMIGSHIMKLAKPIPKKKK